MRSAKKTFGDTLRALRATKGEGIKKTAPKLAVDYSYLSKIENNYVVPSEDFVRRVAALYADNSDQVYESAGVLPPDVAQIIVDNRPEVIDLLRRKFGRDRTSEP